VEDQNRPPPVTPGMTPATPPTAPRPADKPSAGWVVSPAFDLLFLANAAWPLLLLAAVLVPTFVRDNGQLQTEFWQVYFLTTPHRWITLFLVAADRDRREGHGKLFVAFAVVAAVVVGGVWAVTGSLTCLLLLDYVWNAWHFASQHQGVLRMYSKKAGGGPEWLERHALRAFVVYTLLRTAGWTTGEYERYEHMKGWMNMVDLAMLAVPGAVLVVNLIGVRRSRVGKLCYLVSLLALYAGLLLCLRNDWRTGVFALTAASSTFHAVEYLAVVSHYAKRRESVGSDGLFRRVAKQWLTVFVVYVLTLGLVGIWAGEGGGWVLRAWLAVNVWAAFLHYTYDGFIWKLRKPATAHALGVQP
jgi:hypothetical protein